MIDRRFIDATYGFRALVGAAVARWFRLDGKKSTRAIMQPATQETQ
jgi:hypothetical protein